MRVNYVMIFVSDMKRSVAFYRDVIGLSLKFESPVWSEFATDGATIALHAISTDGDLSKHAPGQCRPGLRVCDLDGFHARMLNNHVSCIQQPQETFGARVAQYVDPDGLVISVGEDRNRN